MNAPGGKTHSSAVGSGDQAIQGLGKDFPRETAVLQKLKERLASIRGAIEAALRKRKQHSEIVADEITHFQESLKFLTNIKVSLEPTSKK